MYGALVAKHRSDDGKQTSLLVLAAHFFASEFCVNHAHKSHSEKKVERREAPGVVGHATRANVATRSRFGRGARHRTIRLREPPASGARRLPALHCGFSPRLSTATA